jgi:hypothetical protein
MWLLLDPDADTDPDPDQIAPVGRASPSQKTLRKLTDRWRELSSQLAQGEFFPGEKRP